MEITAKTYVSTKEIALILGVTARWVQQLTQDGIFRLAKRNRYNLAETIQAYLEFRAPKEATEDEKERLKADLSIKKANAIMKVLEARELQGKMHRSEDVEDMTEDLVFTIRGMLLALPANLAVGVTVVDDPAEAAELIRKEVHSVMNELSNYRYNPGKSKDRVEERVKRELRSEVLEQHDQD